MIVLPEERREPSPEARAWSEYLAWTRNASPSEYTQTEQLAWFRLERALLTLRLRQGARLNAPAPGKALVTVRHTPRPLGGGGA